MLYNMQKDAFTAGTNVFAAKMAGREFADG